MDYGIAGKVALVGGASKGLGRATAAALAGEGVRVALVARDAVAVEAAAKEIAGSTGAETLAVAADLASAEGVDRALAATVERFGPIDILATNTGGPRPGKFDSLKEADWDAAYDLLLKSAIRLIRGVLPGMRERGWGRIVGVTSVSVKEPIDVLLLSNVFRAGVTSLFKSLATDLAGAGITVNTILPGLTDTERSRSLYGMQAQAKGLPIDDYLVEVGKGLPLGRLNRADEFGRLAAFLCSQGASGITGCAIPADGGQLKSLM